MAIDIYSDGSYLNANPDWHAGDSAWKASQILAIMERNNLRPHTVCEVGCGAGEILVELARRLPKDVRFEGYEVSADAYAVCAPKANERIEFHLADLLREDRHFDVALAIDVFEHVEDCFTFLRGLRGKAKYKIFHIPLDLTAINVARRASLVEKRRTVGHLHYFTKETALATLQDAGYSVVDHFYTSWYAELEGLGWKSNLLKYPRKALRRIAPDLAPRLLGGFSLIVLAE